MLWIFLALAAGFLNAAIAALQKKTLESVNPYYVPLATTLGALPFFLAAILLTGFTPPTTAFWLPFFVSGTINVLATLLLMQALKSGDLSLTIPYLGFSPVFLVVTSYLILGETTSAAGLAGIMLVAAGAVTLQWQNGQGLKGSYKNFLANRSSQIALLVSFLYSISTNFDKLGVKNSGVIVYPAMLYALQALVFGLIAAKTKMADKSRLKSNLKQLALIGPLSVVMLLCYCSAITQAPVAYVIALKRTAIFWSVVIGYLVFQEQGFTKKAASAAAMIAGVLLIALR